MCFSCLCSKQIIYWLVCVYFVKTDWPCCWWNSSVQKFVECISYGVSSQDRKQKWWRYFIFAMFLLRLLKLQQCWLLWAVSTKGGIFLYLSRHTFYYRNCVWLAEWTMVGVFCNTRCYTHIILCPLSSDEWCEARNRYVGVYRYFCFVMTESPSALVADRFGMNKHWKLGAVRYDKFV